MRKTIHDFTDAELAQMVRDSVYLNHAEFGEDNRFLLVMAVPYGKRDEVYTLPEALESFAKLFDCSDWFERVLQVYDHEASGHFYQASHEELDIRDSEGAPQ